jgi:hypothetical protein
VGGNGSTKTPRFGEFSPSALSVNAYATHFPSGEKLALNGSPDDHPPNGSVFLAPSVSTQSEYLDFLGHVDLALSGERRGDDPIADVVGCVSLQHVGLGMSTSAHSIENWDGLGRRVP